MEVRLVGLYVISAYTELPAFIPDSYPAFISNVLRALQDNQGHLQL